jgi:hypothetical protein
MITQVNTISAGSNFSGESNTCNGWNFTRNYVQEDKENNLDVSNAALSEGTASQHQLKYSRTEENFHDISKKLNPDKVNWALLNKHNGGIGDLIQKNYKREKRNV